ncbi:kinase-like protein [Sporormia fimetaria CBS 119925]|uniref:non-specific serine/threonine protein kinase n=1 Tax=Sporormia fimetaria CBS 119925 TaxID=1340428 RepID=A0A6A6V779_9PLEO|nr:kinase-like protein [Sporormia fimetaria CBS 119925]
MRRPDPAVKDEHDKTPRSEEPPAPSLAPSPGPTSNRESEPGYFSPRPIRPYNSRLPASTPVSSRPSPTASAEVASLSVSSSPAAHERRPSVHRDDSNASTLSAATVRAQSVDPTQTFGALSRGHLDGPHYPNQSYAALQFQSHNTSHPGLRRGLSRHSHFASLSGAPIATSGFSSESLRDRMDYGSRTAGNSPASSPGLFSPTTPPLRHVPQQDDGYYPSPYLHHTHRQQPKETHRADVDVDPVSGRKIINQYEVMDELGRGVHGKVKLGRDLETGQTVAIKIVDRYAKRRKLNRDSSREDKIKKEIAILKKARHPNIVSLLEVIDDPRRMKVYIVLEHVELGEVRWRAEGEKEICLVEWRRFQRESKGIPQTAQLAPEDEQYVAEAHRALGKEKRQRARLMHKRRLGQADDGAWSLEHGGVSDEDYTSTRSRASTLSGDRSSRRPTFAEHWANSGRPEINMETAVRDPTPFSAAQLREALASTGLEGTMYGAYDNESMRSASVAESARGTSVGGSVPALSVAGSSSSRLVDEADHIPEHFHYVPFLTIQAAREAFRDTLLGLEFLHFQGVVHRDIKPANLLQTKEHRIKISDFGVSYLGRATKPSEDGEQSESDIQDDEAVELAKTVGTPAFYAPELCQLDGNHYPVTPQIDIWSLGVTLYCLIYGRVPFHGYDTFRLMKTIVEEDVFISRWRLKAVTEQSNSRPSSHGQSCPFVMPEKRAPHCPEYETVDDRLFDLLKRMLTKDPQKRITITEIKRHPWVVEGLSDVASWVEDTDPAKTQLQRIQVSNEDVEKAVVSVTLVDRVRSGVRRTLDTVLSMGRRGASRKRAQSTATSPDQSSIGSFPSSSTISRDSRRPSLAINQTIFEALSRSRGEPEHPLSQSVSASPEARERARFFDSNSRTASPAQTVENSEHPSQLPSATRPLLFERAHSAVSSAASVRTVRQSDMSAPPNMLSPTLPPPPLPGTPTDMDPPSSSTLGGIFGGVPRLVNNMRSRERLSKGAKRSSGLLRPTSEVLEAQDDVHSGPSVALSPASAAGQVNQPDILKDLSPSVTRGAWPSMSHADPVERAASRQSSVSSASSHWQRAYNPYENAEPGSAQSVDALTRPSTAATTETSDERYARVKEDFTRRRVAEELANKDKSASAAARPKSLTQAACPMSPDDVTLFQRQKVEQWNAGHGAHDASLDHYNLPSKGLVSSSSDDYFSITHSTSDPSIPSVVSAVSSDVGDDCSTMRHGRPSFSEGASPPKPYSYTTEVPAEYEGDTDHPVQSDDDSSEEEFLVMRKKKPHKRSSIHSISNAELARSDIRRPYLSERRRSARSGSDGTVKKVTLPGSSDGDKTV